MSAKALVRVTPVQTVGEVQSLRCKGRSTQTHILYTHTWRGKCVCVCVSRERSHITPWRTARPAHSFVQCHSLSQHALFPHVVDPVCAFGLIPMACAAGGRGGTLPLCHSLIRISDSKKQGFSKAVWGKKRKKIELDQGVWLRFGGSTLRASSQGSWLELLYWGLDL